MDVDGVGSELELVCEFLNDFESTGDILGSPLVLSVPNSKGCSGVGVGVATAVGLSTSAVLISVGSTTGIVE